MKDNLLDVIRSVEVDFNLDPDFSAGWDHLQSIVIREQPLRQRVVQEIVTGANLRFFPGIDVIFEGQENIPSQGPFIITMNHTDDYNYLPLTLALTRQDLYSAVWIKDKNYDNAAQRAFFDSMGMIPVHPAGAFLRRLYKSQFGRDAATFFSGQKYKDVKDVFDGKVTKEEMLKRDLDVESAYFVRRMDDIRDYHQALMQKVGSLTLEAFDKGLYLLVFPEGSRSVRLSEGRTGVAEVALHTEIPVIPIGCNGGDRIYPPHSAPLARGPSGFWKSFLPNAARGVVVYNIGKPLTVDDALRPYRIKDEFELFSPDSQVKYASRFKGARDVIMYSIHGLLDERHQNKERYG